jgi:hypothetical protein
MESPPAGAAPAETPPEAGSPAATRSVAERRLIALVVAVVVGLVLVAIGRFIGPDVMRQVRRWSGVRPVVKPTDVETDSSLAADTNPRPGPLDRSVALAADAQISPPRRRAKGGAQDSPAANQAASLDGDPADPEGKNDGPAVVPPVPGENVPGMVADDPRAKTGIAGPQEPAPVDVTTGMLETAAQLVNLSWQDFDYPVEWHAAATSKPRMLYVNHRNRLLKAIAHTSPSTLSLEMARKDYAAARAQFAEDPRLDYAFGLVLWKHGQIAEAIDMFQTAARLEGVPFLPAAFAVAWGKFLNHDERRALDQLDHISRVLASSTDAYPPDSQKEQAALSIGRALGYLTGPGQIPDLNEAVELTSVNILKRLPGNLRETCETGRMQIGQRQSELLQMVDVPFDGIRSGYQMHHDDLQSRIDKLRGEMRDARLSMSRSHLTHVDAVAAIKKEGLDLRAQLEKLQSSVKKQFEEMIKLDKPQPNVAIKTMPQHYNAIVGPGGQTQVVQSNSQLTYLVPETASARASRVSQLMKAREERRKIERDLAKLRDQQADLVARRHKAEQDHKDEKDEARRERVAGIQEQRELERKLVTLNQALRRTVALREGVDTIAAYIPWNIEVEGEALWQALAVKPVRRSP